MSQLGWIDFSPDDRNKVRTVLSMLSEPGTLDELGVGQVRDAFSDLLFPGISTIQTRAKYFITIPRILRDYQLLKPSKKHSYKSLKKYLSDHENQVAKTLVSVHGESEDGIIGRTRIDSGGVERRPSEVYWNGLRTFGLVKTKLSLTEFCRHLESQNQDIEAIESNHKEGSDDYDVIKNKQLIDLPDLQTNWMTEEHLDLNLSHKEAEFLKGKFIETSGIELTIPTQLLKNHLIDKALESNPNKTLVDIDILTELVLSHDQIDSATKHRIDMADQFSLAMEGPHIRYNVVLAKNNEFFDSAEKYEDEYQQWLETVRTKNIFRQGSDNEWLETASMSFDKKRNFKNITKSFVREWCEAIRQDLTLNQLDDLVTKQAIRNKGNRSLLKKKITTNEWVGMRRLDYRWGSARTILNDIKAGLNAST